MGIAIDLENLREGMGSVVRLLRLVDPEDAVVHLVGAAWAQELVPSERLRSWVVRREVNPPGSQAADAVIHDLLDRWREEGRVAVVVSSDGGFAISLAAHREAGIPALLVTPGRPARRLLAATDVYVLSDAESVERAADAIEAAR